jgi:hypothetical protein
MATDVQYVNCQLFYQGEVRPVALSLDQLRLDTLESVARSVFQVDAVVQLQLQLNDELSLNEALTERLMRRQPPSNPHPPPPAEVLMLAVVGLASNELLARVVRNGVNNLLDTEHPLQRRLQLIFARSDLCQALISERRLRVATADLERYAVEEARQLDVLCVAWLLLQLEPAQLPLLALVGSQLSRCPESLQRAAAKIEMAFDTLEKLHFPAFTVPVQIVLYFVHRGNLLEMIQELYVVVAAQTPALSPAVAPTTPPIFEQSTRCSECGNAIGLREVRYKCGHCVEYELCEDCEATTLHTPTHIFLKIRPIAQLAQGSLKQSFPILANRLQKPRHKRVSPGASSSSSCRFKAAAPNAILSR